MSLKMSKTIAYIWTPTDKQDLNNRKLQNLEYARKIDLEIDEFAEITNLLRYTNHLLLRHM